MYDARSLGRDFRYLKNWCVGKLKGKLKLKKPLPFRELSPRSPLLSQPRMMSERLEPRIVLTSTSHGGTEQILVIRRQCGRHA